MAYERTTSEGIRSWLSAELSTPGWNSSAISKGLTEDVMEVIVSSFADFDSRIKQAILLSCLYMRKGDLLSLGDGFNKIIQLALNDSDEFVQASAHTLAPFPDTQKLDTKIDTYSDGFKHLLESVGESIRKTGFNFHSSEDLILQLNARSIPPHVSPTYSSFKSTHTRHFTLTTESEDIISAESRHARFKQLVEEEERSVQQGVRTAQYAQKRAGADLASKAKRVASPTSNASNPFPFPPAQQQQQHSNIITALPGGGVMRQVSAIPPKTNPLSSVPTAASNALFNKRPARPSPSGAGSLFINKRPSTGSKPTQRLSGGPKPSQLPGFYKERKVQMLDFDAATEIDQNNANEKKAIDDAIKAKKEAKLQEQADKRRRVAEEKEAKKSAKAAAVAAAAAAAAATAAEAAEAAAQNNTSAETTNLPKSPTSAPTSPKTPSSPISSSSMNQQHVFAIPTLPIHFQQESQQNQKRSSENDNAF